jgi:hypothetical protein
MERIGGSMTLTGYQVIGLFVGYYVFNAFAASLPAPKPEQVVYGTAFRFVQRLCANADRVAEAEFAKYGLTPPIGGASFAAHTETDILATGNNAGAK